MIRVGFVMDSMAQLKFLYHHFVVVRVKRCDRTSEREGMPTSEFMTSEERACTRAYAVGNEAHLKTLSSLVRPTPKPMKAASPSTIQMAENGALGEGVRHPYAASELSE